MAVDTLEFVQAANAAALEGHRDLFQDGEAVRIAGSRRAIARRRRSPSKHSPNPRPRRPWFERSWPGCHRRARGLPGQLHDGVVDDGCALAEFLVGEVSAVQNDAGLRVDNPDRALPTESRGLQQGAVTKRLEPLRKGAGVVRKPIQHLHAPLRRSIRVERVERPRPSLRCQDRFDSRRSARCRLTHGHRRRRQAKG